jgi:hypothetical protein
MTDSTNTQRLRGFGRFVTDQMVTRALNATVEKDLSVARPSANLFLPTLAQFKNMGGNSGME